MFYDQEEVTRMANGQVYKLTPFEEVDLSEEFNREVSVQCNGTPDGTTEACDKLLIWARYPSGKNGLVEFTVNENGRIIALLGRSHLDHYQFPQKRSK